MPTTSRLKRLTLGVLSAGLVTTLGMSSSSLAAPGREQRDQVVQRELQASTALPLVPPAVSVSHASIANLAAMAQEARSAPAAKDLRTMLEVAAAKEVAKSSPSAAKAPSVPAKAAAAATPAAKASKEASPKVEAPKNPQAATKAAGAEAKVPAPVKAPTPAPAKTPAANEALRIQEAQVAQRERATAKKAAEVKKRAEARRRAAAGDAKEEAAYQAKLARDHASVRARASRATEAFEVTEEKLAMANKTLAERKKLLAQAQERWGSTANVLKTLVADDPHAANQAMKVLNATNRGKSPAMDMKVDAGDAIMTPWVGKMKARLAAQFPMIPTIGGSRPGDPQDHGKGLALDVMVHEDEALGDAVAAYAIAHFEEMNLSYVIWKQKIYSPRSPQGRLMEDRGSITQNHFDHPHLSFKAGSGTSIPY